MLRNEGINLELDFFYFNNQYKFSKLKEIARLDTIYNKFYVTNPDKTYKLVELPPKKFHVLELLSYLISTKKRRGPFPLVFTHKGSGNKKTIQICVVRVLPSIGKTQMF